MKYYCQNSNHKPVEVNYGDKICPVCHEELDWESVKDVGWTTAPVYPKGRFLKIL